MNNKKLWVAVVVTFILSAIITKAVVGARLVMIDPVNGDWFCTSIDAANKECNQWTGKDIIIKEEAFH